METTRTEPVINVNLGGCVHCDECTNAPVLIPCPVPRSVTFSVVLGECTCCDSSQGGSVPLFLHARTCPRRPVNVSCSIAGKTWGESEVTEMDNAAGPDGFRIQFREAAALAACRALWGIVKAVATGEDAGPWMLSEAWAERWGRVAPLFAQRDEVFSALADMARAEQDALSAQQRVDNTFPFERYNRNYADHRATRPSVGRLAAYVDFLIASVNTL